jgi:hypothetical protein
LAISPKDRRDRADATTRTAKAEIEAGLQAARKKTARLKAERLARDAEQGPTAGEAEAPAAKPARSPAKGSRKRS